MNYNDKLFKIHSLVTKHNSAFCP